MPVKVGVSIGEHLVVLALASEIHDTRSPHTGARLLELNLLIVSSDADALKALDSLVQSNGPVQITGLQDPDKVRDFAGMKFSVRQEGYSYTEVSPVRTLRWHLKQSEAFALEALKLGDWQVSPYHYNEEFQGSGEPKLTIHARVDLSDSEVDRYLELPLYFEVTRVGINPTPRTMRFGRCLWSKGADGLTKVELLLTDKANDEEKAPGTIGFLEPERSTVQQLLRETRASVRELLNLLRAKGTLEEEEVLRFGALSPDTTAPKLNEFDRVPALDTWLDPPQA